MQKSPIGLHIVRCDEMLPFAEAQEKIIKYLSDKRRAQAQREWIKNGAAD